MFHRSLALVTVFLAFGVLRSVASARADSRLLVLGVSGAGDFEELDESIVESARADSRFRVVGDAIRPESARREARCGTLDDVCLQRLAARRDVDRILYGSARPAADDPERIELTLRLYDQYTSRTRDTLVGTIEVDRLDHRRHVDEFTEKFIPLFARLPEEGTAVIRAEAGSTILLDGRSMGTVPSTGEIQLTPLRVGRRILRVQRPNSPSWEAPIVVRSRDSIRVTIGMGAPLVDPNAGGIARRLPEGEVEPPPDWVLTVPSDVPSNGETTDYFSVGVGLSRVHFSIPILEDHVRRGEIRTTTNARVGFLPNVSSGGARVTAKLHF